MQPNPENHNTSPDYLRELIDQIKVASDNLTIGKIADILGIDRSQFRAYLVHQHKSSHRPCPYVTQYALEKWASTENIMNKVITSSSRRYAFEASYLDNGECRIGLLVSTLNDSRKEIPQPRDKATFTE